MNPTENDPPSPEDRQAGLFAALVIQQTNAALMYLGLAPHPQTGKPQQDLEAAELFIDTLTMLEAKTKGNLSAEEQSLLKESLTSLRLTFVQAVSKGGTAAQPAV